MLVKMWEGRRQRGRDAMEQTERKRWESIIKGGIGERMGRKCNGREIEGNKEYGLKKSNGVYDRE